MSYRVFLNPGAEDDTEQAYNWYEDQRKGLGEEFLVELESIYRNMENFPRAFGKLTKIYRRAPLKRFPYLVIYEIKRKEIIVYAVFHMSRNPKSRFRKR
jgi:toxin ParE1/3/4